ncbi:MAG TPA: phospholipase D-like domain-containing protein [Thermomicrobiaceae bacterium]|nr:phospholipase D-like domain-containing protein [Thermomicrobiaceae bacterium]
MAPSDDLSVMFLAQGMQSAPSVAETLAGFITAARQTLDIAIYDAHLSSELEQIILGALHERAAAGVDIRVAYDEATQAAVSPVLGLDPPEPGTLEFVQSLGLPARSIGGPKLMHQKYLVRDAQQPDATVWTGSLNLTDDAFTLQENNVIQVRSPEIAAAYSHDFQQLWQKEIIDHSGNFPTSPVQLRYAGQPALVQAMFSPGQGESIDNRIAHLIAGARRRILLGSMLLNASSLLEALLNVLRQGRVPVRGIYDATQMEQVVQDWSDNRDGGWKIRAFEQVVGTAQMVGKRSTPYTPTSTHDFMHDKIVVVDDTVVTGSYNLSRSATLNAENVLFIESVPLAAAYAAYLESLMARYGG